MWQDKNNLTSTLDLKIQNKDKTETNEDLDVQTLYSEGTQEEAMSPTLVTNTADTDSYIEMKWKACVKMGWNEQLKNEHHHTNSNILN